MGVRDMVASVFRARNNGGRSFEAASNSRRMRGFQPARQHINAALQAAGDTLKARARFVYENDGLAGNIVDEWTSAVVGTGIKPRPKFANKAARKAFVDMFADWTDEADADGQTDYYGLQEKVAREAYLAGECFVRFRQRRPGDMATVPLQLQIIPSEQLDLNFDEDLGTRGHIRAGIEFNPLGQRVAYHFFKSNPLDAVPGSTFTMDRTRVPAADVLHIFDARQGGQIRGVARIARCLVKLFALESYDDAELDRKKNAALYMAFLVGRGDNPMMDLSEGEEGDDAEDYIPPMEPGAIVDLGDDKDIRFSQPVEVGGSYEPFQYRTILKICAGCGVPYAVATGDVTRGNFSNVRTAIQNFRRRTEQWQHNTLVFQFCRPVVRRFVEVGHLSGSLDFAGYTENPGQYKRFDHLPPPMAWVDPEKDVNAEIKQVRAGLKSRTQSVAERGYDIEDLDAEIEEERKREASAGLVFDSNAASAKAPSGLGAPVDTAGRKPEPDGAGGDDEGGEEDDSEGADNAD